MGNAEIVRGASLFPSLERNLKALDLRCPSELGLEFVRSNFIVCGFFLSLSRVMRGFGGQSKKWYRPGCPVIHYELVKSLFKNTDWALFCGQRVQRWSWVRKTNTAILTLIKWIYQHLHTLAEAGRRTALYGGPPVWPHWLHQPRTSPGWARTTKPDIKHFILPKWRFWKGVF